MSIAFFIVVLSFVLKYKLLEKLSVFRARPAEGTGLVIPLINNIPALKYMSIHFVHLFTTCKLLKRLQCKSEFV